MVALAIFSTYITYSLPRSQAHLLGLSFAFFLSVRRKELPPSEARLLLSVTQPTERIPISFRLPPQASVQVYLFSPSHFYAIRSPVTVGERRPYAQVTKDPPSSCFHSSPTDSTSLHLLLGLYYSTLSVGT